MKPFADSLAHDSGLPVKARESMVGMVGVAQFCDLEVIVDENGEQRMRRMIRTELSLSDERGDGAAPPGMPNTGALE